MNLLEAVFFVTLSFRIWLRCLSRNDRVIRIVKEFLFWVAVFFIILGYALFGQPQWREKNNESFWFWST